MSNERVLAELKGRVLTLVLNRPDKRNAIDTPMVDQLLRHLERADLDAQVGVVALRGAGKDFCAGADLAEMLESVDRSPAENEASARRLGEVFIAMRRLPKPVVAVVHGRALAGGCGLASACDLVFAHADASFGYPEVRRGFVPAMVMAMLRRSVGEKVAFDLVGTGRVLTSDEARGVGLVARVLPDTSFEEEVAGLLSELAAASGSALAFIKRQLYEIDGRSFEEAIDLGAKVNATARATPDFRQAVSRFLEK
ncbi:MAG: enoyl-CoA hydratase/isomerase family protein [Gemmatimonadota bacterium]|nr:MAG: enoyl-CoA hydratase/isomerase family protein [Gemmatimonadota bacterium]